MIVVQLLTHTPAPEATISAAAKLCYSASSIASLQEGLTPEKTESFLGMLTEIGHESPIEHASFTFGIEGVSRSLLAQITRHRMASFSVQSQRYVRESHFEFVLPPAIAENPQAAEIYLAAMAANQEQYDALTALLKADHQKKLMSSGVPEKDAARRAEKMAIEDARFVLPNACTTKMICTMNARSLQNFFAHRCCMRAQWEIRELAVRMLREVKKVAPTLFAKMGPPCFAGPCREGKLSCGHAAQMREAFSHLTETEAFPWDSL